MASCEQPISPQRLAVMTIPDGQKRGPNWRQKIAAMGPWDAAIDPLSLEGPPSLPMPVKISDMDSLQPFFDYLSSNSSFEHEGGKQEPYYATDMLEFNKGVVYVDGRMDLCKMVVGPPHIGDLMKSLEPNMHVKHFLLGNNIIGPAGARAIAQFAAKFPNRMETWYLAGNAIDGEGLGLFLEPFCHSTVLHSLWLKRNPLGPASAHDLYRLVSSIPTLKTLDLDLTALGDIGVEKLFSLLKSHYDNPSPTSIGLRHIYLNANGIGAKAAQAIGDYLSSPQCELEGLFMSCNPVGDDGAAALASGLQRNTSLLRLTLASCGLKTAGGISILSSLQNHPKLLYLDIGQSFATQDLGQRYNWFEDGLESAVIQLIEHTTSLRGLNLGITALNHPNLESIAPAVIASRSLCSYSISTIYPALNRKDRARIKTEILATLSQNIKTFYGEEMTFEQFNDGPIRFLRNTTDVRFIDSVYRNRDAQKARRRLMTLEKWWNEDDETLKAVAAS
ncbi:hypothetical protein C8J56DRAFT_939043 [Mycena floridula]|nr:hypothetical protein C8J56DRAFT_939043 [Mycena floridula]